MKILFCCEYYDPSIGGVQEVVKQLATRLSDLGHEISVATSYDERRHQHNNHTGVLIYQFAISGNNVNGIQGDKQAYCEFLLNAKYDIIVIKAAQQWTFDLAFPILSKINAKKVFIPCGFSSLYNARYKDYYLSILPHLSFIDKFIFYTANYRDINFLKQHFNLNYSFVSNGADEDTYLISRKFLYREQMGIPPETYLFLNVGTLNGQKGHWELCVSYLKCKLNNNSILYLNANIQSRGLWFFIKLLIKDLISFRMPIFFIIFYINHFTSKKVVLVDYTKNELCKLYTAADLFLFASNVEYSPLVLFEALASGTPFVSSNVGNAAEIASKTAAGFIVQTRISRKGYSYVDINNFAETIERVCVDKSRLDDLSKSAISDFYKNDFSWKRVVLAYEKIFKELM